MSLESLFFKRDDSKIKVVAGDLAEGFWELSGSTLRRVTFSPSLEDESLDLSSSIKQLDIKDLMHRDSFEPLVGAGIGGLIGLRLFGPLGAAGGAFAGFLFTKKQNEVSATVELRDGRKFIAVMTPEQFQRIHAFAGARSKHYN